MSKGSAGKLVGVEKSPVHLVSKCCKFKELSFFSFSVFVNIKVSAHNLSGLKVLTNISSYKKICPMS